MKMRNSSKRKKSSNNEAHLIASSAAAAFVLSFLLLLIADHFIGGTGISLAMKLILAGVFAVLLAVIDKFDKNERSERFEIDEKGRVMIKGTCIGVVAGDVAGSKYEFNNIKTKDFPLFSDGCRFTDDTVMTCAVKSALARYLSGGREGSLHEMMTEEMKYYGNEYPDAGYGGRFSRWLISDDSEPYNSYGNGSAMRVSACAFLASDIEEAREWAVISSEVTHNHPDGINGAEATAAAIFTALNGGTKEDIKREMEKYYHIDFTVDEIRPTYGFNETCPGSVPQAFECFLEAEDYEDCIRNCISIGGDCDTTAAIAGAIAEAYFGVPEDINEQALSYLPHDLRDIIQGKC
ncbi:MAG: ADP-ribosylglycohydrolase family protein [Eubacteriaceae bacterium]|jgi:type I restriction enzyme M protein|nr:ADP-ribosylglycohydrolase family protein [Eubacteriaceae bacterium]